MLIIAITCIHRLAAPDLNFLKLESGSSSIATTCTCWLHGFVRFLSLIIRYEIFLENFQSSLFKALHKFILYGGAAKVPLPVRCGHVITDDDQLLLMTVKNKRALNSNLGKQIGKIKSLIAFC